MVATILTYRAFQQNSFLQFPIPPKLSLCRFTAKLKAISFKSSQPMMYCGAEVAFCDDLSNGEMCQELGR